MPEHFDGAALRRYATQLFQGAGLPEDRAAIGAEILVEGDLLDRTTHGLAQLPRYLEALVAGSMTRDEGIVTVSDRPSAATWDGWRGLGPWLVCKGIDLGIERARQHGTFTLAIRRSHHIAALSAYLQRATREGMMILLCSSDPSTASVAPPGGTQALITPNPLAVGIPTNADPILIDISMSTTTNAFVERHHRAERPLPFPWLLDAEGVPTDDPSVFFATPKGSILPVGGPELAYKGFALGLVIEMLTSGLAGFGRAEEAEGWGASVFLQIISPAAFGGDAAFRRQASYLADAMRANRPAAGATVRVPGERALALREVRLRRGVPLHPSIMPALAEWSAKLGVPQPAPLQLNAGD